MRYVAIAVAVIAVLVFATGIVSWLIFRSEYNEDER